MSETYEYIEESSESPIFKKSGVFRSLSERIVDEFLSVREKNPAVKQVKVKSSKLQGKDPKAMSRGIGKVFLRKAKDFTARVDEKNQVWILER